MRKIVLLLFLLYAVFTSMGQTQADTIEIHKKKLRTVYIKDGQYLSQRQLSEIMKSYPPAYRKLNGVKILRSISVISITGSGYKFGEAAGLAANGTDTTWKKANLGFGLVGLGILLEVLSNAQLKESVRTYNREQLKKANIPGRN